MFEIEYKGANAVIISTKKSKIIVDPKLSLVGLKDLNVKDAVELASEERFVVNNPDANLIIDGPGEYGVAEFDILGIPARRHIDDDSEGNASTMYRVEIDGIRLGIIGNIYEKLSDEQLEQLGVLDILIIPIGGNGYTLDATGAANLVRMIDPKIVIPVHYADNMLKYEVPQNDLKLFISELSAPVETVSKYKFKQLPIAPVTLSIVEITLS
jgi:L-ascorbate metabolism protein UlaG (beta-lactamase superfamily)